MILEIKNRYDFTLLEFVMEFKLEKEFKKQFESYGYKLAEISYSSEDAMCFRNSSHPIDSPFICYYDTIFIKS